MRGGGTGEEGVSVSCGLELGLRDWWGERKIGGTRRGTDESSRDLGSFEKQICNPSHCTCLKGSALLKA